MKQIIKKSLDEYYGCIENDANGRFRSWEHCYLAFGNMKDKNDDATLDYLALHLAFYLASWGMYRGSSFLLQKDYKVHIPAVKIIKQVKYQCLYGIDIQTLLEKDIFDLFIAVTKELRIYYDKQKDTVKKSLTLPSDTLITKILMGVYGCVPAFDRMLCGAVNKYKICSQNIMQHKTYEDLGKFYKEYEEVIEEKRKEINKNGIKYPQMKMLDIILWQIGFDEKL